MIKTIEKYGWKAVISEMWWKWSRCCDAGYSFNNQSSFPISVSAFRKKKIQNQFRFFLLWSVFTDKPASGEERLNEYGDCIKWKTWPASVHYSINTKNTSGIEVATQHKTAYTASTAFTAYTAYSAYTIKTVYASICILLRNGTDLRRLSQEL